MIHAPKIRRRMSPDEMIKRTALFELREFLVAGLMWYLDERLKSRSLEATHSEALEKLASALKSKTDLSRPKLSEASIALWKSFSDQFIKEMGTSRSLFRLGSKSSMLGPVTTLLNAICEKDIEKAKEQLKEIASTHSKHKIGEVAKGALNHLHETFEKEASRQRELLKKKLARARIYKQAIDEKIKRLSSHEDSSDIETKKASLAGRILKVSISDDSTSDEEPSDKLAKKTLEALARAPTPRSAALKPHYATPSLVLYYLKHTPLAEPTIAII